MKLELKIKPTNILLIVAFVASIAVFIATNDPVAFALLVIVLLLPHLSIGVCRFVAGKTKVSFELPRSCSVGQTLPLTVKVVRPRILRGRIELELLSRNILTGTLIRQVVMLEPAWEREEVFVVPVDTSCAGRIEVALTSLRCHDSLGLSAVKLPVDTTETSYTVYPSLLDIDVVFANEETLKPIGTACDYRGKGRDRSEVFDVRDYHEGDSLKSVHWKLSARLGDLIVKEPARPSDYDMALFYDLLPCDSSESDKAKVLDASLSALVSVSLGLVRKGISHSLVAVNDGVVEARSIEDFPMLEKAMGTLVSVPVGQHVEPELVLEYIRAHGITKVILVTDHFDEAYSSIASWTNLSVIHLGRAGGETVSSVNYRISHLTPETLSSKVKSLEL